MEDDSDFDDEVAELREGLVAIKLSKEDKQRIQSPWSKALIIKVYGRLVRYSFLQTRLLSMWKPKGRVDLVDLGKEFFLARFSVPEDYDGVLDKGPWFIGENFLSVRPWEPNFKPSTADIAFIAIWVRINELPIEYYEPKILKQIGNAIGNVLRIDTYTAEEARGQYARFCVQVNVNKPLITSIIIGGREQEVVYKGIHKLCFSCCRVGHRKEQCLYITRLVSPPSSEGSEQLNDPQYQREMHDPDTTNVH